MGNDYDRKFSLLNFTETSPGIYEWTEIRRIWVRVEQQAKMNLFSKVGIGARSALIKMQPRDISLHQAMSRDGAHYFLTSVVRESPVLMEAQAAVVELTDCTAQRISEHPDEYKRPVYIRETIARFPAVLTEKYLGFTQDDPQARTTTTFVLVTPKKIILEVHDLIAALGEVYAVKLAHLLDPYRNEYEMTRMEDV